MRIKAGQVVRVYRPLLKAFQKHIGKEGSNVHFKDFATEEFCKNTKLSDTEVGKQKIKLAEDYIFLLNSVHHEDLLFSYNIAVDRSDEMKRTLKKSAASVGLQLPEVHQPGARIMLFGRYAGGI